MSNCILHTALVLLVAASSTLMLSCSEKPTAPENPPFPVVTEKEGRIFITDRLGYDWDVTNAKNKYNMEPAEFQFGLGRLGIRPIYNPQMITEVDENYPADDSQLLILGAFLYPGDVRAYPIERLAINEVANDLLVGDPADAHVAFAY